MKIRRIGIALLVMMVVCGTLWGTGFSVLPEASAAGTVYADAEEESLGQVSLILTSDMHDHIQPVVWTQGGETTATGGFAPVKTLIDQIRSEWPDSLVLDAGGFSMGTSYQTIEPAEAPALMLMGQMDYDVTTLGAHEYGFGPDGLTDMLNAAQTGGQETVIKSAYDETTKSSKTVTTEGWDMPAVVGSNIDWDAALADELLAENAGVLRAAFDRYGVQDYVIIRRGGIRIAVFGLMGYDAVAQVPDSGVVWQDPVDYAKQVVSEIESNGEADMIICLSQGGMTEDGGEDAALAEAVPGIDVILSGNAKAASEAPVTVGTTTIVSVGCDAQYVGHLVLDRTSEGYVNPVFELLPVDGSVSGDAAIQTAADAYKKDIDSAFFSKYGYTGEQVLANNEAAFTPIGSFGSQPGEESLANLIADAYAYAVRTAEGDAEPVDVAIVPAGAVQASVDEGPVTAAEVYDVLSMGTGPDGLPGYPLVSFYLTGKELKTLADVDISVGQDDPAARMYFKGLVYSFNTHRMIYNRTMDHRLMAEDGSLTELDKKKLYRVVTDLHTAETLKQTAGGSKGMLSVVPKDAEGHTVIEFDRCIVPADENGGELKAWYALASYIDAFEGDVVPAAYHEPLGRKTDKTSLSPVQLFKQPNRFSAALAFLILLPIVIVILIIVLYRRHRHVQRGYKRSMFGSAAFRPNGGKPVFKGKKINRKKLHKWTGRY